MKRCLCLVIALCLAASTTGRAVAPNVTLSSRVAVDGIGSLLVDVRGPAGQAIDELRIELPRGVTEIAVPLLEPAGWTNARDGQWLRMFGTAVQTPFKVRIALFDGKLQPQTRVRLQARGRTVSEETVAVAALPAVGSVGSSAGAIELPPVVNPGESIALKVINPSRTPADGTWVIAGVVGTSATPGIVKVTLPSDLSPSAGIRVTYFDAWGERIVDTLTTANVVVADRRSTDATTPRITGCSRYGFRGESLCVCGNFPEQSWNAITIDGQPAVLTAAGKDVVRVLLPDSLTPGPHTIGGTRAAGFSETDTASTRTLVLHAAIDQNALLRGQSTQLRLAVEGAPEPLVMAVTNQTPHIISIPGGNYQEIEVPVDVAKPIERRVDARSPGSFSIDVQVPGAPCPCAQQAPDRPSTASQPAPVFASRRVLAAIAVGTPTAMWTAAQAVAAANGLAVIQVTPLAITNQALVVFEILDGVDPAAKAAALAAAPGVALSQPDFVYDTSQAASAAGSISYGAEMIGADVVRSISRGTGVRVAVIDTGIDSDNPRIKDKVAEYADVTGAGWTPDSHGTLVAGVIAADAGGADAPAGVAPGAVLVGVKACVAQSQSSAAARCWSSTLARGIDVAASKNVRVMNLSVGGPADVLLKKMVDAAVGKGIAMVSAAGNDGPSGKPSYPAAIDNVIAVTAVDSAGHLYAQATRGPFIALAAPGVDILSTGPGGRNQLFSGTSAATAFASGAVALLLQQSNLALPQLRTLLTNTAKNPGAITPGSQFGILDVCRALVASGKQAACH